MFIYKYTTRIEKKIIIQHAETTAVENKRTKNVICFLQNFLKIQVKAFSTKLITCNLNRYECTQIKIFLAANDEAMY